MIKSPLRYPGGKSKAIGSISALIPEFREFREPMVGGGSVFLHCRQQFPDAVFWINDIYPQLFHFWQQTGENAEVVLAQILKWKSEFQEGRDLHRFLTEQMPHFDPARQAAAFFILNRITFSGTAESGGFSNQAFQKRFTDSSIRRLEQLPPLLQGVKITNLDYEKVVTEPGEDVFIFLDPPYFSATKSALYGKNGQLHKNFDHERFAAVMRACPHRWLITYDDDPFVRELFSFANISTWQLTYGMRNVNETSSQRARELFIRNY
ncbi:MAG TPA: DNA adenine methylase [Saprospiraceae bacterium]|nr:DNA adenine methylase [Saprospiraceae bacterium]